MNPASRAVRLRSAARGLGFAGIAAVTVTAALAVTGAVLGPPLPAPTVAAPTPGPASSAPAASQSLVQVDATGRLSVGGLLTGQLPGAPFTYDPPTYSKGLFREVVIGGVTSDPGWVRNENTPVTVMVGEVEPSGAVVGDPGATGRGLATDIAGRLFEALDDLAVGGQRSDDAFRIGALPARWSHVEVTGRLSSGAGEQSRVSVLVIVLPNEAHVAMVQVRPARSGAQADLPALDAAAASLTAVER